MARPKRYTFQISARLAKDHRKVLDLGIRKLKKERKENQTHGDVIRWLLEQPEVIALVQPDPAP